jgi:hypothetical protein
MTTAVRSTVCETEGDVIEGPCTLNNETTVMKKLSQNNAAGG